MAPSIPATCASLFEKQRGNDGKMYSAQLNNGKMDWKLCRESKSKISSDYVSPKAKTAYDTYQKDGVEYIAKDRGGSLQWTPNDFKKNVKTTTVFSAVLSRRF
jgi:hypothetical protein